MIWRPYSSSIFNLGWYNDTRVWHRRGWMCHWRPKSLLRTTLFTTIISYSLMNVILFTNYTVSALKACSIITELFIVDWRPPTILFSSPSELRYNIAIAPGYCHYWRTNLIHFLDKTFCVFPFVDVLRRLKLQYVIFCWLCGYYIHSFITSDRVDVGLFISYQGHISSLRPQTFVRIMISVIRGTWGWFYL